MITESYLLSLVKECRSDIITCDDCKWNNFGKCRTEEVYNIMNKMSDNDLKEISNEAMTTLNEFVLRGKNNGEN